MSLENRGRKNPIGSDVTWWDSQASYTNDRHSLQNVLSGVGSFVWGYSGKFTLPRVDDGMNVLHGGETEARARVRPASRVKRGEEKNHTQGLKWALSLGRFIYVAAAFAPFQFFQPLDRRKEAPKGGILHFSPLVDVYWIAFL